MPLNFSNVSDLVDRAVALHQAGRLADAEAAYARALQMDPANAAAIRGLGLVSFQSARMEAAEALLTRAAALSPDALVWTNLGDVYAATRRPDQALAAYQRAWTLDPDSLGARNNAAVVLLLMGKFSEAARLWRTVVDAALKRADPGGLILAAQAANNLGEGLLQRGLYDQALDWHQKATAWHPSHPGIASNLVRDLAYVPGIPTDRLRADHDAWWRRHGGPAAGIVPLQIKRNPDPDRPLRIGFVSPDFRDHSVAHFLFPLFEHHDRRNYAFTCYAAGQREDAFTPRLAAAVEHWRKIAGADDAAVARQIDADQIDILIDLAGHTGDNRLPVFAWHAAPIQVAYLGYPSTVGGTAMAGRITDALADPPGMTESEFSEKLWHMPRCAWCYRPSRDVPVSTRSPVAGHIVFGSFNALAKISPEAVRLWAAVLHAVEGSHMLLKAASLQESESRQHVEAMFAAQGIAPDRLTLLDRQPAVEDHLACYAKIDVALDTFPYHGTTTTCQALWMGVPVVTLAGRRHVSRVGASLLHAVGLDELVADDDPGFVTAAKQAAGTIRGAALRERMERSDLRNEPAFAAAFETALRGMWREWCAAEPDVASAPAEPRR